MAECQGVRRVPIGCGRRVRPNSCGPESAAQCRQTTAKANRRKIEIIGECGVLTYRFERTSELEGMLSGRPCDVVPESRHAHVSILIDNACERRLDHTKRKADRVGVRRSGREEPLLP